MMWTWSASSFHDKIRSDQHINQTSVSSVNYSVIVRVLTILVNASHNAGILQERSLWHQNDITASQDEETLSEYF